VGGFFVAVGRDIAVRIIVGTGILVGLVVIVGVRVGGGSITLSGSRSRSVTIEAAKAQPAWETCLSDDAILIQLSSGVRASKLTQVPESSQSTTSYFVPGADLTSIVLGIGQPIRVYIVVGEGEEVAEGSAVGVDA
jgi:hypothetical protein